MLWPLFLCAALGAPSPPTQMALPLPQALKLARLHHPDVQRAEAAIECAMARRVGAALYLQQSPHVSLAMGHRHDSSTSHPASTGREWTVQLAQMVDLAGQRATRLKEVGWAQQVATWHAEEARLHAAAQSATDYVRLQAARALMEVAQGRCRLAERVLAMVQDKEGAGAIGGLERTLAEVELSVAKVQWLDASSREKRTKATLAWDLGLPASEPFVLDALLPPEANWSGHQKTIEAGFETNTPWALAHRPLAQALLATEQGFRASVSRLNREVVPSPSVFVEAQHQQPGQQYFGGGLAFDLPVSQRLQGPRAEARAHIDQAILERTLFERQLRRDLESAYAQVDATARVFATVDQDQRPAALAHADMTVEAWRAGKLDLGQVVQSMRYLAEAQVRRIDALVGFWEAHIDLNRALGSLP